MKYFFSYYLLAAFVFAAYLALQNFMTRDKRHKSDVLVTICCLGSAVWSLGFSILILQTDPAIAYYCRCVGIVGTFAFLIAAQFLVCRISELQSKLRTCFEAFSLLGIPICVLTILPGEAVFENSDWGMTYSFRAGIPNTLYILYAVILAAHIFITILYMMKRSPARRIQAFGRQFLPVLLIIIAGMILDTIFPFFGLQAIPGSTMSQFLGLIMLCRAVNIIRQSRINIPNMSRYVYSSLAMPVLVYDSALTLQIVNDAGRRFFSLPDEGALPSADGAALPAADELFACGPEEIFSFEGDSHTLDTTTRAKEIPCSLDVSSIRDRYGDIIGYLVLLTDQTERVRAMERLEEARREADAANQSKSRFLANMSHEIRTPMNAILGFSELLLEEKPQGKMLDYIQDIKSSSMNLLTTINDILDISRIESGKIEVVETIYTTMELLEDVGQIIRMRASEKNLSYRLRVADNVPGKLRGDENRLRSILTNLLNNAVKYTDEGLVRLNVRVKKRYGQNVLLEFAVSDTGIGIHKEDLDTLFQSFSRADIRRNYHVEGTGLGLSIVKNSVAIMGGQVSVDSIYGKGTCFTVTLPQRIVDARPCRECMEEIKAQQTAMEHVRPRFRDTCVLVVDDNTINLRVASRSLESYGLTVDAVNSGREAVRRCAYKYYPLIFMDQMMPQMDGVEAMKRIREENTYYRKGGEGRIIALTANAITGVREDLIAAGFDDYLEKPMNFDALETVLLKFLPDASPENQNTAEETM